MTHFARVRVSLVALVLAGSACDGQFRFDQPSDGGAAGTAPSDAAGSGGSGLASGAGGVPSAGTGGRPTAGCTTDAQCGLHSLHCDLSSGSCVECLTTSQCQAPNPACDTSAHRCVPCLTPAHCQSGETCETTTHKCQRTCVEDKDCLDPSLRCNTARGTCQQCDTDTDTDDCPAPTLCQAEIELCVQCTSNAQCGTLYCDLLAGQCVACVDSRDCRSPTPFCVPTTHVCAAADE